MMQTNLKTLCLVTAFGAMAACDRADRAPDPAPVTPASATAGVTAASAIKIVADENGYTPSTVSVPKGAPATLEFVRTTDKTCATEVVFPDLNLNKPLPLNTPVDIPVPAGEARTYAFACGMGMHKGKVVVQ
jgi:plastocyanin domain-containing protein